MMLLIKKLRENNIHISLVGNDLKLSYSGESLSPAIIEEIKMSKHLLVEYLQAVDGFNDYEEISISEQQPSYVMSSAQNRIYFLSQFRSANVAYNILDTYVFNENVNLEALEYAIHCLTERHEILRTIFQEEENGEARQYVLPAAEMYPMFYNLDLRTEGSGEYNAHSILSQEMLKPFDLWKGPLIRIYLLQTGDKEFIFGYITHHIITDGWSMGVYIRELLAVYLSYVNKEACPLCDLRVHYKDYARWQQDRLSNGRLEIHRQFWLSQFKGELPVLDLPTDSARPLIKSYNGDMVCFTLSRDQVAVLTTMARKKDATLFIGLLALVKGLLYRYTGQEDIIVGCPIAGRGHAELENQMGVYVNSMALRTRFGGTNTFDELIEKVRLVTMSAYQHQEYPFDKLVLDLGLNKDMSRHPLFDVVVALQNPDIRNVNATVRRSSGLQARPYEGIKQMTSKFDLSFIFIEEAGSVKLWIEFNSDLYLRETITRYGEHLKQLLDSVIRAPETEIARLEFISAAEKRRLLREFNNTKFDYPADTTVIALFEDQVKRTPDSIAVVFGDTALTYDELNRQANRLADYLVREYMVGIEDRICIRLNESEKMIVSVLAVWKAGASYVPVDPRYPSERFAYMFKDSNSKALIDDELLGAFETNSNKYRSDNRALHCEPGNLAYVIYTSGSTGAPKGVMVEHRSLLNLCCWQKDVCDITANDRVMKYAGWGFDASVIEIYPYLICGASIYIIADKIRMDLTAINDYLGANKITICFFPTLICEQFQLLKTTSLRLLFTGGEALKFYAKNTYRLVNTYGPTENTVITTTLDVEKKYDNIPIGKPIYNNQIYILSDYLELQPEGIVGEICIGGHGLGRGYLNNPELTAERYVSNPFLEGQRLYKTGDFGRWLSDGNIIFLGRRDEQTKIRGHRIEPGEIESVIRKFNGIEEAFVNITGEGAEKSLVAYIVSREILEFGELRFFLSKHLPGHMIPVYFIPLNRIPLNENGKIDRKALPHPSRESMIYRAVYVPPVSEMEREIVKIWSEVLGIEFQRIGIRDDFFDLGGHSIRAMAVLAKIRSIFKVNANMDELFEEPTIESLSKLIARKQWAFDNDRTNISDNIIVNI